MLPNPSGADYPSLGVGGIGESDVHNPTNATVSGPDMEPFAQAFCGRLLPADFGWRHTSLCPLSSEMCLYSDINTSKKKGRSRKVRTIRY